MAANLINIEGAAELERVLKRLPDKIGRQVLEGSLRSGARIIAKEARKRVPVRTRELQKSITVGAARGRGRRGKLGRVKPGEVVVGFKRPVSARAHLTEFGTRHSRAQPFLRPALISKGSAAIDAIGKALGKRIEKAAVKLAGPLAKSGLLRRRR